MRYFICTFGEICLGFPAKQTERIIQADRIQTNIYETSDRQTFISLPALLRQNDSFTVHGLVLKSPNAAVLLTPKIDIELDIPQERISRLPEIFNGVFSFFSGAFFSDAEESFGLILLLDPEKIMENCHD